MDELDDDVEEVEDSMSSSDDGGSDDDGFTEQFHGLVEAGEVENINVVTLKEQISKIEDAEVLQDARSVDSRKTAKKLYSDRIDDISSSEDTEDSEEAEESEDDDAEEAESMSDMLDDDNSSEEEEQDKDDDVDLTEASVPGDEEDEEQETEEEETDDQEEDTDMSSNEDSDVSVDIGDLAPNAMTQEEAEEKESRQGIMVWGDPGMGKTHFSYTMPDPVCIIDTEGKSDDISHKFDGTGNGDPFIWQPSDYDEAVEALDEAFEILREFHQQAGILGTIVVDSMSIMWDWSQQKYVEFAYPTKDDTSEVEFSSSMGRSGESDWKQIKRYHNVKFRQRIIDSPFHFGWTQMRGDDYAAVMEGEAQTPPDKPVGEKENPYKANYIIHLKEDDDGAPIGNLEKSALTKHNYTGLRYPTFQKHKEILDRVDAVETGDADEDISDIEAEYGIELIQGNPSYVIDS